MPGPRLIAFLAISLLLVAGCEPRDTEAPPEPPPSEEPPPAAEAYTPDVAVAELVRANAGREPDQDRLPILARIEEPHEIDRETRPNRHHPEEADTLYVYHYDGLQIEFLRTHTGREIIRSLEIADERYETPEGVRVGMARDDVIAQMGEPDEREADQDRYFVRLDDLGPDELFAVEYRDDRAQRLRYGFYVD